MKTLLVILALLSPLFSGCESKQTTPADSGKPAKPEVSAQAPLKSAVLLGEPIEPVLVELPTAALPVWRQARGSKPALVLLSQDPLLAPLPEELRDEALTLVREGSPESVIARTAISAADPLLLPSMALSAALEAGFFSRVIWVLPSKGPIDQLQLKTFQEQLLGLGAVDQAEAASFIQTVPGTFAGSVRGIPFQAVHIEALPPIDLPVVVHIDLSYIAALYSGEIKTPLYPLLGSLHSTLRETQWQAVAVTISSSTLNGVIPLPSRFVGVDMARFFRQPELLDAAMPGDWNARAQALYLENFFKKEEVRAIYEEMEKLAPRDPSVKYALYQVLRQFKEGDKALEKLAEAVRLDRVYALEYLALADVAQEQNLPAQVQRMLMLAAEALADNPFMQLRLAAHLKATGQTDKAEKLLVELRKQPWSPVYYPDMSKKLE